jgi:poly(3-hydroxybutyrate) depolymerase
MLARILFVLALAGCGGSSSATPDASDPDQADAGDVADAPGPGAPDARPTSGCGNASAGVGLVEDSITIRGVERTFLIAVPSDYDANVQYSLVFAFHGLGSNASQARYYFGVEEASSGAAIMVYPNGLPKYGNGSQTGWDWSLTGEDVDLVDSLLEVTTSTYCIDSSRIFATGHSHGGYFSNFLACARASVLRAIAPVAGGGPFYVSCESDGVAAWIAHGIHDSTVAFSYGEGSRDYWRTHNGCATTSTNTTPSPCVAYDGCDSGFPVVWCAHEETEFGGHWWPSFAPQAIWDFFASF